MTDFTACLQKASGNPNQSLYNQHTVGKYVGKARHNMWISCGLFGLFGLSTNCQQAKTRVKYKIRLGSSICFNESS